MTNLVGKLVEGWTTLASSDGDAVVRQFTSLVRERTHHLTSCRVWYDYNGSQELPDTQVELLWDGFGGVGAGLYKDDNDDMENVPHDTDHDESWEVNDGDTNEKALPIIRASSIVLRDTGVSPSKRGRAP
ncbi:hypothetical protein D1007_20959 [Hordeum vulgare]|nr:hypothetical protein D1007_20959 [Hordeum vulgare]